MDKRTKILIVDDDPRNIFALNYALKIKGYDVLSCTDALQAMGYLEDVPQIGIVLLDMMMPDIDGFEMMEMIRAKGLKRSLGVIAVTARTMPGDMERCFDSGVDGFVSKPIDLDLLLVEIERLLERSGKGQ